MPRVGTDTGGTFTDLVAADGTIHKLPSTPHDPSAAVAEGLRTLADRHSSRSGGGRAGVPAWSELAHGTTVATNALLERTGAPTALVTTAGFADVIEIGRQDRPALYDPRADRPPALVPRAWRFEVVERLAADGSVLVPLDLGSLPEIPSEVQSVAVSLLHVDRWAGHEQAVAEELATRGFDVTCSHELTPEFREFERTSTTVVNAWLRPVCAAYLRALAPLADEVLVMSSAGGLLALGQAVDAPARLLLSGPAGGVRAAAEVAMANGFADAVSFDMGGTSTDVCLIRAGRPEPAAERDVEGYPIRLPSLDLHTIGAGGGSIARLDAGGALAVGPQSAGAVPGPAAYGRGGGEPTVTDADLVLGRIPADHPFPGLGHLDVAAARAAIARAGLDAEAIVAVVDAQMEQAIRRVTVERGVDPRDLALVAFGGAGPLHAVALADALGMAAVVVPARAGVLSAAGILAAPRQVTRVQSWADPLHHGGVDEVVDALAGVARAEVGDAHARVHVGYDCRYRGQSHEITVEAIDVFGAVHEQRNGYRSDAPVELLAVRVTAEVDAPVRLSDLPALERAGAVGPAVLAESDCTVWVPPGWRAEPGAAGALVLRRVADQGTE